MVDEYQQLAQGARAADGRMRGLEAPQNRVNVTPAMAFPTDMEFFDPAKGTWSRFVARMEDTFEGFNVTEEPKKKSLLIHYMSFAAYNQLCDRILPRVPRDLTYKEICDEMRECLDPEPLEIVEIFKFQTRKQKEGESCEEFLAALRKLSTHCKFGENLKKSLRNQFVVGLRNNAIQRRLLEKRDLTLEIALDTAKAMEISEKGEETIAKNPKEAGEVLKIEDRNNSNRPSQQQGNAVEEARGARKKCFRCGVSTHLANDCNHKDKTCFTCNKKGHLSKVCMGKGEEKKKDVGEKEKEKLNKVEDLLYAESKSVEKIMLNVKVEGKDLAFEVDSGSPISVISMNCRDKMFPRSKIFATVRKFVGFNGTKINIVGFLKVSVRVKEYELHGLNLYVAEESSKIPLMGREWARKMHWLDWNEIITVNKIQEDERKAEKEMELAIGKLKKTYSKVFENSLGKVEGCKAELKLKDDAQPVFLRPRRIPLAKKQAIEDEIEKQVKNGAYVKVNQSRWATPVVAIPKAAGNVRLCGDYSVTLNPNLIVDKHPLPTVEELFADMAGGDKFSKLDLSQAYMQLEVREEDRELLTINTHKGLYQPTRLMYGVASAVAIWQRIMESMLQDIPGVKVFLDDIRITGKNNAEHLERLTEVLKRLQARNMRVNFEKCEFFASKISYCGYVIDRNGIHKDPTKIEALMNMPRPKNKDEVRAYNGFVQYYGRFFPNLSTIISPITNLLRDEVNFEWDKTCEDAFKAIKQEMSKDTFLAHYDPNETLVLAVDASPVGVGACLSHRYEDKSERPLFYASQSLTDTQRKYAQHDKEAYAIIFGVKKFFTYLYGKKFVLITDNKALSQIMNPEKGIPVYTALRMQHYSVFLKGFDYTVEHRTSEFHGNADGLSRLPLPTTSEYETDDPEVAQINLMDSLPVMRNDIRQELANDIEVAKLIKGLRTGVKIRKEDRFGIDQEEFSLKNDCLVRGLRTYIPGRFRKTILQELHEGHVGITKMKQLARAYCWWPSLDKNIEELVQNCTPCQENRSNPPKVPVHAWEEPNKPFERIHVDYAGPIHGKWLLIVVDSYSKWPEVAVVTDTTSGNTIKELRKIFATHGLPEQLVTDQGRQFISQEFEEFCKRNGIDHKMGAPYHPATNGQAERYVRTIKEKLMMLKDVSQEDVELKLSSILLNYRRTPHSTSGISPSEKLFGRKIRSRLDFILPGEESVRKEIKYKEKAGVRKLNVGDRVAARNYRQGGKKWSFGTISQKLGSLHYMIKMDQGKIWKRHIDQLRRVGEKVGLGSVEVDEYWEISEHEDSARERSTPEFPINNENEEDRFEDALEEVPQPKDDLALEVYIKPPEIPEGRPKRNRRPPDRLNI
ncbi:uncharacterized protein K02A2.6-like [Lutzomyia longipalpis]|uniref:uncharacterized protein K02A2.6-like n=1 Tax=Lutzomyia longipalpis TaxID=7200 RepID=UPI002483A2F1|nr:uncharacterized protein K02A2.6-like [Lutzomyia longipalpis]